MGKQSRKKSSKKGSKEHKAKLKERRERREKFIDNQGNHDSNNNCDERNEGSRSIVINEETILEGDRVWILSDDCRDFLNEENQDDPGLRRGVVRKLDEVVGDDEQIAHVQLFASLRVGDKTTKKFPMKNLVRDCLNFTTKFQVGDAVVCSTSLGRVPGVVTYLWPVWEFTRPRDTASSFPIYQVLVDPSVRFRGHRANEESRPFNVCAHYEDGYQIIERTTESRFSVGDRVLINRKMTDFNSTPKRLLSIAMSNDEWIHATVSAVDAFGPLEDQYGAYECAIELRGQKVFGYVPKDTDEYIALITSDPRQRLINAIEQDCSFEHIDYLVRTHSIDASLIKELLISKAIKFGSFNMCRWLEEEQNVDLASLSFPGGNNILHEIVSRSSSPHTCRFIENFGEYKFDEKSHDFSLYKVWLCVGTCTDNPLYQENDDGKTWRHILRERGDFRAIDIAISPKNGLFWSSREDSFGNFGTNENNYQTNDDSLQNEEIMKFALECFLTDMKIMGQVNQLTRVYSECEDSILQHKVMQNFCAKKCIRFTRKWQGHDCFVGMYNLKWIMKNIVSHGFSKLFGKMLDADETVLHFMFPNNSSGTNLFVQPELYYQQEEDSSRREKIDIVGLVISGEYNDIPSHHNKYINNYISWLIHRSEELLDNHEGFSLLALLQNAFRDDIGKEFFGTVLEYQIATLTDSETLPGRIKILDILTNNPHVRSPNAIEAVEARQCGVLCWMVNQSYVKLDSKASTDTQLQKHYVKNLEFLGPRRRIPDHISTGTFLSFACVEYDSLHALAWLSKDQHVSLTGSIDGFTFLHICAYFGRLEIILWFFTRPEWKDIVSAFSSRKGFEYATAVHVAVIRNHINAADLLVKLGCPCIDGKERSPDIFALKSKYDFARKWGEKILKPIRLEEDVRKFFKLLAKKKYDAAKRYASSSACLALDRWEDAEIDHASNYSLPSGETYEDILSKCINDHNEDFVLWLCGFVTQSSYGINFWSNNLKQTQFWGPSRNDEIVVMEKYLDLPYILDFIHQHGNEELIELISDPSMHDIRVVDSSGWLPPKTPASVRQRLVVRLIYEGIIRKLPDHAKNEITKGGSIAALERIVVNYRQAAQNVAGENKEILDSLYSEYNFFSCGGQCYINMNAYLKVHENDDVSREQYFPHIFLYRASIETNNLYCFLAVENRYNLLPWCVNHGKGWTAQMELDVIRIAAYHGHDRIVSFFLDANENKWLASHADFQVSAMLGAAEAGRERYWKGLIKQYGLPPDQLLKIDNDLTRSERSDEHRELLVLLFSSHAVVIVFGYLSTHESESRATYEAMILLLLEDNQYNAVLLLKIAQTLFKAVHSMSLVQVLPSFICLLDEISTEFNPRQDHTIKKVLLRISQDVLEWSKFRLKDEILEVVTLWMTAAVNWGVDIQSLKKERLSGYKEISPLLLKLQDEQRSKWAKLDIIKKGQPLSTIKTAVESRYIDLEQTDRSGLSLIHLASAYDRIDVLDWLLDNEKVDVWQKDNQGRTPLEVARASKASTATKWIEERQAMEFLTKFLKKNLRKRLACIRQSRIALAATKIQAIQRGRTARRLFRDILLLQVEESLRFHEIWERNLTMMSDMNPEYHTWSSARRHNENRSSQIDDLDEIMKTSEKLEAASTSALCENSVDDYDEMDQTNEHMNMETVVVENSGSKCECTTPCEIIKGTKILFTDYVMKWLRQADAKYREFFVRRLKQLQQGERSRILAKRLKGSNSTIFETYLEQKSGHRILWRNEENGTILIWFIARHKNVSKLMQLIDDSERRSARQRISLAEALPETALRTSSTEMDSQQHRVLLNPLGNVPLKVFEVETLDMEEIKNDAWSPRLYLTEQERDIIESDGTVLLLGRSGTGKTICICNRMDLDARKFQHNDGFKQLFVARSQRLCRYVSETVGFEAPDSSFTVFSRLIDTMERCLPKLDSTRDVFLTSQKMDFARFKREIYSGTSQKSELQIDPLLVWTSIRTFCKGSIEALQEPQRILGKDAFVNLGERRCRLGKAHREFVYGIFLRYQKICSERNLWDDCDRITSLILRLQEARGKDLPEFARVHLSKIYVDEIQDYTQAEICIFFLLSGAGDLFMAGDPAQSVVEGVEFRFEDIRSVAYHMSNRENRDLVPQKPKVVTVNFRSHSGVMDTAAAILRRMFDTFPYSAKQLAEDRGLFKGSRPGVFHCVQVDRLRSLISKKLNGVVVLTHDSSVRYWKKALGDYQLVYGIRAAKGLEFKSVIILDFFSDLPREFQKPWRNLMLGRMQANPKPELEGHLKLLYTAVTRCMEQLFFAETVRSCAGDAFVRWITTATIRPSALATRQNVDEVEKMALTQDEWVASGLDNAEMAESTEETNLEESISLLEKALYCFEQGKDAKLSQKARTHRTALLFRLNLVQQREKDSSSGVYYSNHEPDGSVEVRAAELMGQLLLEGSLLAALRVVKFSLPYFGNYARERLDKVILAKVLAIEQ